MPGHVIEVDFHIGQTVAFRLDAGSVGLVTSVCVRDGSVSYGVTWEDRHETAHYAFELRPSDMPAINLRD